MFPTILTLLFICIVVVGGIALVTYSQHVTAVTAAKREGTEMAVTMRWFAYVALLILMFRVAFGALGTA